MKQAKDGISTEDSHLRALAVVIAAIGISAGMWVASQAYATVLEANQKVASQEQQILDAALDRERRKEEGSCTTQGIRDGEARWISTITGPASVLKQICGGGDSTK